MNLNEITYEHVPQLEAIVRRLAADQPDEKRQCFYTMQDGDGVTKPHCIIGVALFEFGVPIEELSTDAEGDNVGGLAGRYFGGNSEAWRWLTEVQGEQDSDSEWCEAVRYADAEREASQS